ncbi:MAG: SPOR domain-containing protein [Bacteroidia bacterium]
MKVKFIICVCVCVCLSLNIKAQTKIGSVKIKGETIYLDSIIDKKNRENTINQTINGYRIQLFSGNERNNANNIKTKFLKLYPDQTAYLAYNQPYFKIRVGDFRTKLDAKLFYNKIKGEFNECIIIADKINLPKL